MRFIRVHGRVVPVKDTYLQGVNKRAKKVLGSTPARVGAAFGLGVGVAQTAAGAAILGTGLKFINREAGSNFAVGINKTKLASHILRKTTKYALVGAGIGVIAGAFKGRKKKEA